MEKKLQGKKKKWLINFLFEYSSVSYSIPSLQWDRAGLSSGSVSAMLI